MDRQVLHYEEEILLRRKIFGLGDNKSVHLGKKMLLEFVFLGSEFRRKRLGSTHMLQFDLLHVEDDVGRTLKMMCRKLSSSSST